MTEAGAPPVAVDGCGAATRILAASVKTPEQAAATVAATLPIRPSATPRDKPIRSSRPRTFAQSPGLSSPTAIARMIRVEDCEPALPPEAMISGMNKTSSTVASSAA